MEEKIDKGALRTGQEDSSSLFRLKKEKDPAPWEILSEAGKVLEKRPLNRVDVTIFLGAGFKEASRLADQIKRGKGEQEKVHSALIVSAFSEQTRQWGELELRTQEDRLLPQDEGMLRRIFLDWYQAFFGMRNKRAEKNLAGTINQLNFHKQ